MKADATPSEAAVGFVRVDRLAIMVVDAGLTGYVLEHIRYSNRGGSSSRGRRKGGRRAVSRQRFLIAPPSGEEMRLTPSRRPAVVSTSRPIRTAICGALGHRSPANKGRPMKSRSKLLALISTQAIDRLRSHRPDRANAPRLRTIGRGDAGAERGTSECTWDTVCGGRGRTRRPGAGSLPLRGILPDG